MSAGRHPPNLGSLLLFQRKSSRGAENGGDLLSAVGMKRLFVAQ
jgi:hypothetical protein